MSASRGRSSGSCPQGTSPQKRRSERKSANMKKIPECPVAAPSVKRSITAKKIVPRKTLALTVTRSSTRVSSQAEKEKENSQNTTVKLESANRSKSSPCSLVQNETSSSFVKISTSVSGTSVKKSSKNVLSPIPTSTVLNLSEPDSALCKKVRRSYSRLEMSLHRSSFIDEEPPASHEESSDSSTPNQSRLSRRSFFGFDNLLSQEALADVSPVTKIGIRLEPGTEIKTETSLNFNKVLDTNLPVIAIDLPGISMAKEKRKRRKILQIDKSDLDEWAAQMNAQFDEAEKFDLFVE